jgi:hypothetical protein
MANKELREQAIRRYENGESPKERFDYPLPKTVIDLSKIEL